MKNIKVFNRQQLLIGEFRNIPDVTPTLIKFGSKHFKYDSDKQAYVQTDIYIVGMMWLTGEDDRIIEQ